MYKTQITKNRTCNPLFQELPFRRRQAWQHFAYSLHLLMPQSDSPNVSFHEEAYLFHR